MPTEAAQKSPETTDAPDQSVLADYKIEHCKVRARRGLPSYAVFKLRAGFEANEFFTQVWDGISLHNTKEEACAALSAILAQGNQ